MKRLLIIVLVVFSGNALADRHDVHFATVDVYLDSDAPIAAWQFELNERSGTMRVVGVEQGESGAYTRVPYYDRNAVERGEADRIIVADYTLADRDDLPSGRFRIATIHVMLRGDATRFDLDLITATTYDGKRTDASATLSVRQGSER